MPQPNLCAFQFIVIAIAPDPLRDEHVNIGVALYQSNSGGFSRVRLNPDFRRVRQLSPGFDTSDLAGLEADLDHCFAAPASTSLSRDYLIELARETFGHSLRFSPPTAVLTADPAAELDQLYRAYAAPPDKPEQPIGTSVRSQVLRYLERVFCEERVLPLLNRRFKLGEYLGLHDQYCFDFHYCASGQHRVIQALAPSDDDGPLKEFCFTVQWIRERIHDLNALAFATNQTFDDLHVTDLLNSAGIRFAPLSSAAAEARQLCMLGDG